MTINSLRDAFQKLYQFRKAEQIDREIGFRLMEMEGREYVPFIARTQPTFDDEDVITLEGALALQRWYYQ
jgi:hypothetical protein